MELNTKNEQRRKVKDTLAQLGDDHVKNASDIIFSVVTELKEFVDSRIVFIYNSMDKEVDTSRIIEKATESGKVVCLPRINGDIMECIDVSTACGFATNEFGIVEPIGGEERIPDLIIMPLLAFDDNKRRLGRGKGYYDRFCSRRDVVTIALALAAQKLDHIAVDEWDHVPDMIVTEKEILK